MRTHFLAVMGLFLVADSARAQGLRGTVVDSVGRPLPDAEVIIVDPATRVRTDTLGGFLFTRVDPGQRVLRVRLIGYRPYEATVTVSPSSWTSHPIVLRQMPTMLGVMRITDTRRCAPKSLEGFECRRQSGIGLFRDAGELRSLHPSSWADMLDGMPALRRVAMETPDGLDWRPAAPPSGCLREIFNGEDPRFDGNVRKRPVWELVSQDVVAIEYYTRFADVPEQYKRFAWPSNASAPCSLLVYWLREAPPRRRSRGRVGSPPS